MSGRRPRPRPDLEGVHPYRTAASSTGRILLHANENPYPLPADVHRELVASIGAATLNRYPDPEASGLVRELAAYAGVDPEWIWTGVGSNEVLLHACLAYGGAARTAVIFEPTYRMHYRQAQAAGTRVEIAWRRDDFTLDVGHALETIERLQPEIVFLCTPNNPTGTVTPAPDVRRIAAACPGLLILDEAYYEFSNETFVGELGDHPNVLVVRTLSKAFRVAGLRVGYGIAHPELLAPFRSVRMPYATSTIAQAVAEVIVRRRGEVLEPVQGIVAERERLAAELAALEGVEVFPSGANFLLFRHPEAPRLVRGLAEQGIVVRDFTDLAGCENGVRVTVGTPEHNDALLQGVAGLL